MTSDLHFAQVDNFLLLRLRVDLNDAQRRSNAQRAIEDVDSKDDRITLRKRGNDLETAWPDGLRRSIPPLCLHDLLIVRREGIEEVVDDVR